MQELERMIKIYHTGFMICLVLTCLFLAAAIFIFFKFDIHKIIDMRTGRGAKKTIQKMEEINAKTGKLRQDMVSQTPSRLRPEERIAYPVTEEASSPVPETTVLSQNIQEKSEQTGAELPGTFEIKKEIMWVHTEVVV